jgi:hypothetical protein
MVCRDIDALRDRTSSLVAITDPPDWNDIWRDYEPAYVLDITRYARACPLVAAPARAPNQTTKKSIHQRPALAGDLNSKVVTNHFLKRPKPAVARLRVITSRSRVNPEIGFPLFGK